MASIARPPVLPVVQVARLKRVDRRSVIRAIGLGRLTGIRIGRTWAVIRDERLEAWVPDRARQRGARKRWRQRRTS
jgi:hypothetical protein